MTIMRLEPTEMQRRVRAMMAYADVERDAVARHVGVSPSTIDRYSTQKPPVRPRPDYIELIAEACKLPVAFVYADFSRLAELVPRPRDGARLPERLPDLPGEAEERARGSQGA